MYILFHISTIFTPPGLFPDLQIIPICTITAVFCPDGIQPAGQSGEMTQPHTPIVVGLKEDDQGR